MTFRIYVEDLPEGYAAAARKDDEITVIIVDREVARQAHATGASQYTADLVNEICDALDHEPGGIRLVG